MAHNEIEVMIYGENVAELRPVIPSEDVTLRKVIQVENPNYLFLQIKINKQAKAGAFDIDFYKRKRKFITKKYELRERTRAITGFDASDAIYLITPDRFANGDPANDDIPTMKERPNRNFKGGRHGGDIQGIRDNLDYIKDMGFTAIWLNPVLENDMIEYSYHGYSTTDYYKVDPRFGTNEAYQQLADEARTKGIKLIMDMIVNHCGLYHWWMEDLPSEDWINQWDEYTQTNHKKTLIQDPYAAESDYKAFIDGWFVPTMPDLNQRNEQMANYLIQNSIWWVEYLGLSGIRMDTYPYPGATYMAQWTEAMMRQYPNLNIVGEEWFNAPTIVSFWQRGKQNPNGYTSELKSVMDFPVNIQLIEALNSEEAWFTGWIQVYEMIAQDFLYPDPMNLVTFPDNHDMQRIFSQLNEDYGRWKQAIAFTLTMRGIPQMYYGTEILMTSTPDHGIVRTDFPGGWEGDKVNAFTGEGLTDIQKEAQAFVSQLLRWRKTTDAIHTGKLTHYVPQNGVYVYFRYTNDEKVMVILNKNKTKTTLDMKRFEEMAGEYSTGKDVISGKIFSLDDDIELPMNDVLVLELK